MKKDGGVWVQAEMEKKKQVGIAIFGWTSGYVEQGTETGDEKRD